MKIKSEEQIIVELVSIDPTIVDIKDIHAIAQYVIRQIKEGISRGNKEGSNLFS